MFNVVSSSQFEIQKHLVGLLYESPFYTEICRRIRKVPTDSIPTIGVTFDVTQNDVCMGYNPEWLKKIHSREKYGDMNVRNVLEHEFDHLLCMHLDGRSHAHKGLWNVATDCAINSLIVNRAGSREALPVMGIVPGFDVVFENEPDSLNKELARIVKNIPPLKASEWYYSTIIEELKCAGFDLNNDVESYVIFGGFDDHSMWDKIPQDSRMIVINKIRNIIQKAVERADTTMNGWGNIPAEFQKEIRASVSPKIDWKKAYRQFLGSIQIGGLTPSIKRINKKFPYIHPGKELARNRIPKLLICIDQSGSVDDHMIAEFFAEIASSNKKAAIDYLPFDAVALEDDIVPLKKGSNPKLSRTRCGGTDFNAPTRLANSESNRGRWDGMVIMTDGECEAPVGSRIKRAWVVGKGHKLLFPTDELVINMNDTCSYEGSWR